MTDTMLAFVFPGQAAQCVGMGKAISGEFEAARNVFELANRVLDQDLAHLCFEGPKEKLDLTSRKDPTVLQTIQLVD